MSNSDNSPQEYKLPARVVTRVDLSRLQAEAERVNADHSTNHARETAGDDSRVDITMSDNLSDFVALNELNFDDSHVREEVIAKLSDIKNTAPSVHMTFSTEADGESLQQLVTWFRTQVHPMTVLSVGLQPSLVAGVYLRTPNHVHDLSLRAALRENRGVLVDELQEAVSGAK